MDDYERKVIQANDEQSMRSRVFVGNLNTMLVSREEMQHRFGKYGPVRAVGIFKGYAFIQFDDEATARLAVSCEDQQMIVGQKVDCNLASEPKPNQRAVGERKPKTSFSGGKPKMSRFGSPGSAAAYSGAAGYGYPPMMGGYPGYYDPMAYGYPAPRARSNSGSFYSSYPRSSSAMSPRKQPGAPPSKRARPNGDDAEDDGPVNGGKEDAEALKQRRVAERGRMATLAEELRAGTGPASNPGSSDVLVCATCRLNCTTLLSFVEHKRAGCSLRACAACTCDDAELRAGPLSCANPGCNEICPSAWALLHHFETAHAMTLHKLVTAAPAKTETTEAPKASDEAPAAAAAEQKTDAAGDADMSSATA